MDRNLDADRDMLMNAKLLIMVPKDRHQKNGVKKLTKWSVKPKTLVGFLQKLKGSFA